MKQEPGRAVNAETRHAGRTPCRTLILIPAYNSVATLEQLSIRLSATLPDADSLVIDDGSRDDSVEKLISLGIPFRSLQENQGKGRALRLGFVHAIEEHYDSVITMDSDLQHAPEELPRFIARDDGRTILLGTRQVHPSAMPLQRWGSNTLTSLVHSIAAGTAIRDAQCGFRLIPVAVLKQLHLTANRFDIESDLLFTATRLGFRIDHVPVSTIYLGAPSAIRSVREIAGFVRQLGRAAWHG